MNIPTVKTIVTRLNWLDKAGDPATLAKQIRAELERIKERAGHLRPSAAQVNYHFQVIDKLLRTHGIERIEDRHGHIIDYINTGDTYTPTLLYNRLTGTLSIGSWGDIVERHMSDYP